MAEGFPGGAAVEGLPAGAGDAGSSPGLGGSRVPVAERLGPVSRGCWACASGACAPNGRGRDGERPAHRDEEWPPLAAAGGSPRTETKTQQS